MVRCIVVGVVAVVVGVVSMFITLCSAQKLNTFKTERGKCIIMVLCVGSESVMIAKCTECQEIKIILFFFSTLTFLFRSLRSFVFSSEFCYFPFIIIIYMCCFRFCSFCFLVDAVHIRYAMILCFVSRVDVVKTVFFLLVWRQNISLHRSQCPPTERYNLISFLLFSLVGCTMRTK